MNAKTIQKYKLKSISQLKKIADRHFNKFIRFRDQNKVCVSCNQKSVLQAGHFYSAGHYPILRYNENNCFGQCKKCNLFLSGNLNEYRKNLIKKIGREKVEELDLKVAIYKQNGYKWDRYFLIETIEKYKLKCKKL